MISSPDISVLIATRDRDRLLESTLLSFCKQTLSNKQWEVIVVDNGSQDETRKALSCFLNRLPLTVLYESTPSKTRALNRAMQIARGRMFAFTDDDVEVCSTWLAEIYRASSEWATDKIFCGPIHPIYPPGTPPWLMAPPYSGYAYGRFELGATEGPIGKLPFGANFAVRADTMENVRFCVEVGPSGRTYRIGGETELLQRLTSRGLRVIYLPSCSVNHFIRRCQVREMWLYKRSFCYGRGMQYLHGNGQDKDLVLGLPRRGIVLLQTLAKRFARSVFRGKHERYNAGSQLAYMLGVLYEHRLKAHQLLRGAAFCNTRS